MISSEAPEDETAQPKVAVVFLEAMLYKAFEYTGGNENGYFL